MTAPNWRPNAIIIGTFSALLLILNFWISPTKHARAVDIKVAKPSDMKLKILCAGLLKYKDATEVKAEISENVFKKYVSEGDQVQPGDVLVRLSSQRQKIFFEKESNRLKDSEKEVTKAEKEYAVQKDLYRKQAVARTSVEKAEEDLNRAKINLGLLRQEFQIEQKNFEKTIIVSQTSGTVLLDFLQKESFVESGKALFVIGTPQRFQLNGKVDELNIQDIAEGAEAQIQIDAFPKSNLMGRVSKIEPQAETGTFSKIGVKIDILDAQGLNLKPNLTAQGLILGSKVNQSIWMPTEAVKAEVTDQFVFVVDANAKVNKRIVQTGRIANDQVEITSGLEPGELVAVSSADLLMEGEIVNPKLAQP